VIVKQTHRADRQTAKYGYSGPVSKPADGFCHRDLRKSAENGPDNDRSGLSICGQCGNWRAVAKKQQSVCWAEKEVRQKTGLRLLAIDCR